MKTQQEILDEIAEAVGRTEDEEDEDYCWDHQVAASVIENVRFLLESNGIEVPVIG